MRGRSLRNARSDRPLTSTSRRRPDDGALMPHANAAGVVLRVRTRLVGRHHRPPHVTLRACRAHKCSVPCACRPCCQRSNVDADADAPHHATAVPPRRSADRHQPNEQTSDRTPANLPPPPLRFNTPPSIPNQRSNTSSRTAVGVRQHGPSHHRHGGVCSRTGGRSGSLSTAR